MSAKPWTLINVANTARHVCACVFQAGSSLAASEEFAACPSPIGPVVFFFGCRNRAKDFLYEAEWTRILGTSSAHRGTSGNNSSSSHGNSSDSSSNSSSGNIRPNVSAMFTAFSRDQPQKVGSADDESCSVRVKGLRSCTVQ